MKPFQDIDNASHTPPQMESSGSDWVIVPEPEVKKNWLTCSPCLLIYQPNSVICNPTHVLCYISPNDIGSRKRPVYKSKIIKRQLKQLTVCVLCMHQHAAYELISLPYD